MWGDDSNNQLWGWELDSQPKVLIITFTNIFHAILLLLFIISLLFLFFYYVLFFSWEDCLHNSLLQLSNCLGFLERFLVCTKAYEGREVIVANLANLSFQFCLLGGEVQVIWNVESVLLPDWGWGQDLVHDDPGEWVLLEDFWLQFQSFWDNISVHDRNESWHPSVWKERQDWWILTREQ